MNQPSVGQDAAALDAPPGDEAAHGGVLRSVVGYMTGLVLAGLLTAVSFRVGTGDLVWQPGIVAAIAVLAIAQMGIHLVFFLHVSSGPDSTNNVLALAFGILIVFLVVVGTIWITNDLNDRMMPMSKIMEMQR